ncbi:DUF3365 domain-containing protein [Glaciecola sp. SC05]|uniref:Tll0287-like domain-containing protein n=1 Tax=Glaciecola sp. SC05 TaxID=1987355 RepID=UPI00352994E1
MKLKLWLTLSLLCASMSGLSAEQVSVAEHVSNAELNSSNIKSSAQAGSDTPFDQMQLRKEAQQKIQQFASTLKSALVGAIQSGGLAHAVDVCHSTAPQIAEDLSTEGWHVARTSLKARNEQNQPDSWEVEMLQTFDQQFKSGIEAKALNAELYKQAKFRYMQAIPTDQVCLACHGVSIDAALSEAINKQYPKDRATGFTLEDIRGAFTVSKALND